jgi:hypothetical protein
MKKIMAAENNGVIMAMKTGVIIAAMAAWRQQRKLAMEALKAGWQLSA